MTEKRFELKINNNGQFDIVDWYESKKKNAICIYNDLGVIPFSSASSLCDLLNQLNDENEQLKAQLYCDSEEGVCSICKHHYLEKGNIFYISKCEKGHEKCSKESVRHCEDFKLKELQE